MSTTNDGGPAFPSDFLELPGSGFSKGMSVRDVFAAAPMSDVELETLRMAFVNRFPNEPLSIARLRYWRADTMLEARSQWQSENRTPAPLQTPVVQPLFPEVAGSAQLPMDE